MKPPPFLKRLAPVVAVLTTGILLTLPAVAKPPRKPPTPGMGDKGPPGPAGHGPAGHGPAGHGPAGHGPAGHGHAGHEPAGHGHVDGKKGTKGRSPNKDEVAKRLNHIKKRHKARRKAVAKHQIARRKSLRRTLRGALKGKRLNQQGRQAVTQALRQHGKRVAQLRRIQFVAAENEDFDTAVKVGKILARENARHAIWLRGAHKLAGQEVKPQ